MGLQVGGESNKTHLSPEASPRREGKIQSYSLLVDISLCIERLVCKRRVLGHQNFNQTVPAENSQKPPSFLPHTIRANISSPQAALFAFMPQKAEKS